MAENINVVKRNGRGTVPLNIDKIHSMVGYACEGLTGVSESQVEIQSGLQFYNNITTEEIQQILINSANNLITLDNPNYQFVAARLLLFGLRKEVFGQFNYIPLNELIEKNITLGVYDKNINQWYSTKELEKIDSYIKHKRDFDFTYAGLRQVMDKYLVQDRRTKQYFESPQMLYMMVALTLFAKEKENRLAWIKSYYDAISQFYS